MFLIIQVILMFLSMGWSTIQMRHLIKNSQILKSGLYEALSVHDQGNDWHESYYHRKAHPRAALPNTSEDTNDQQTAREPRCYNLVDCRHQSDGKSSSTHHTRSWEGLPVNKFAKLTNLVVGVETVKGTSLMKMMRRGTSRLKASPADRIQIAVQ